MKHGTRLALATFGILGALWTARETSAPEVVTVAPLALPVDLLAGGLDEWLFVGEAGRAEAAAVASFADGRLALAGDPVGALTTRRWYRDYVLELEWRWSGERAGNSGLLVHATTPLSWHGWPRCLEVQLRAGDAGDLILMGDHVGLRANDEPEPIAPAGPGRADIRRRVENLVDGLERPLGEWNRMRVTCAGDRVEVEVNGTLVNLARELTVSEGAIALQSEGAGIEFRTLRLAPLR